MVPGLDAPVNTLADRASRCFDQKTSRQAQMTALGLVQQLASTGRVATFIWRGTQCEDGFISHERRSTFQHGMDADEILRLAEMLGLRAQRPLPSVGDASLAALTR